MLNFMLRQSALFPHLAHENRGLSVRVWRLLLLAVLVYLPYHFLQFSGWVTPGERWALGAHNLTDAEVTFSRQMVVWTSSLVLFQVFGAVFRVWRDGWAGLAGRFEAFVWQAPWLAAGIAMMVLAAGRTPSWLSWVLLGLLGLFSAVLGVVQVCARLFAKRGVDDLDDRDDTASPVEAVETPDPGLPAEPDDQFVELWVEKWVEQRLDDVN